MAAASDQDADAEKAADLIEKKQAEPLLATTDDLRAKEKDAYEDKDKLEEDEEATIDEFIHKEGGWGWVIVIATGYCFGTLMGMINNYALIFDKFDKVYNGTENHIFYAGKVFLIFLKQIQTKPANFCSLKNSAVGINSKSFRHICYFFMKALAIETIPFISSKNLFPFKK